MMRQNLVPSGKTWRDARLTIVAQDCKDGGIDGYKDDLITSVPDLDALPENDRSLAVYVVDNPGATLSDFMKRFEWSYGTARYYRDKLVRMNVLHCDRSRSPYKHYPTSGLNAGELERLRLKDFFNDPKRAAVFELLNLARDKEEKPGGWATPNAVANQVGASHDFVVKTLQQLHQFGIVEIRPTGYRTEVRAAHDAEF